MSPHIAPEITCDFCGRIDNTQLLTLVDDGNSISRRCTVCKDMAPTFDIRPVDFVKHDSGKPQWSLLPKESTEEVVRVLEHGAKKYGAYNWRVGTEWRRYIDAAVRHITSFNAGEDKDPESGYNHLAHAICCLLFLIDFGKNNRGTDDRFKQLPF